MAMVVVTHDWGVVADIADRAIVMYAGQIVEEAPIDRRLRRAAAPVHAGLFASTPAAASRRQDGCPTIEGTVPPPVEWPVGCRFQNRCPLRHGRVPGGRRSRLDPWRIGRRVRSHPAGPLACEHERSG